MKKITMCILIYFISLSYIGYSQNLNNKEKILDYVALAHQLIKSQKNLYENGDTTYLVYLSKSSYYFVVRNFYNDFILKNFDSTRFTPEKIRINIYDEIGDSVIVQNLKFITDSLKLSSLSIEGDIPEVINSDNYHIVKIIFVGSLTGIPKGFKYKVIIQKQHYEFLLKTENHKIKTVQLNLL